MYRLFARERMSILTPHEATKHEGNKERELRLARSRSRASNSGARQDDCGSPRRSRVPRGLRPEGTRRLERVVVVQTRERPAVRANLTARERGGGPRPRCRTPRRGLPHDRHHQWQGRRRQDHHLRQPRHVHRQARLQGLPRRRRHRPAQPRPPARARESSHVHSHGGAGGGVPHGAGADPRQAMAIARAPPNLQEPPEVQRHQRLHVPTHRHPQGHEVPVRLHRLPRRHRRGFHQRHRRRRRGHRGDHPGDHRHPRRRSRRGLTRG